MRYRILAVLAALMTVIGLATPAASASSVQLPAGFTVVDASSSTCNACHLMANVDQSLGITYPGTGDQATVTTSPANITIEYVTSTKVLIHNNSDNCLGMRDAANGHAVMEESGCDSTNPAQQFLIISNNTFTIYYFESADYGGEFIGVSCTPSSGSLLWGAADVSGTCIGWDFE